MNEVIKTNMYDIEEVYENCTVQILRNSLTGECSIGWWRGSYEDMTGRELDA